jgi:hypothetical protein
MGSREFWSGRGFFRHSFFFSFVGSREGIDGWILRCIDLFAISYMCCCTTVLDCAVDWALAIYHLVGKAAFSSFV